MDDRDGFTLIEVLVSLSILTVTLMLTYRVISGAISATERSERWADASCLAEALILDAAGEFPETGESEGKFPSPMDAYSWKRAVREAIHSDAREVEVSVLWTSEGREEQVTLTGLAVK